ncbi:thiol peroxidase [Soonwooa sp.]|uniref:thiol peroxidase n=1 Tax=Soonwooa sp. TaxID=1938592 RepID=UPI00260CFA85|nr:thiol peroxidase [Soonwooa sp.]
MKALKIFSFGLLLAFGVAHAQQGTVLMRGKEVKTFAKLPTVGIAAPDFELTNDQMQSKSLNDYKGKYIVLNIFPSVDTSVCSMSVRTFNQMASEMPNTTILCISKDLPFAQKRFCGAEGINNVVMLSDFRSDFGKRYGVEMVDGPSRGLLSRAVVVIDPTGKIVYEEQVADISNEPNYDLALKAIKK